VVALEDQSREHKEKHAEVNKLKDGQEDDGSKRSRIWEDKVTWRVLACDGITSWLWEGHQARKKEGKGNEKDVGERKRKKKKEEN